MGTNVWPVSSSQSRPVHCFENYTTLQGLAIWLPPLLQARDMHRFQFGRSVLHLRLRLARSYCVQQDHSLTRTPSTTIFHVAKVVEDWWRGQTTQKDERHIRSAENTAGLALPLFQAMNLRAWLNSIQWGSPSGCCQARPAAKTASRWKKMFCWHKDESEVVLILLLQCWFL